MIEKTLKELSNRTYSIVFIQGTLTYYNIITIDELMKGDEEFKYAIQERFDEILDLTTGDRLVMNFNRDNADSSGIIKRIK